MGQYLYAAAALAAVILLGLGYMQWRLWSLDSEIKTLELAQAKVSKAEKDSLKPIKDAESLDAFAAGVRQPEWQRHRADLGYLVQAHQQRRVQPPAR